MRQRDVQGKIVFLMDNFEKIEILKQCSYDELSSRFELVDSVIHRLQTSIEALLDIGRYVIASLGLKAAGTNGGQGRRVLIRSGGSAIYSYGWLSQSDRV